MDKLLCKHKKVYDQCKYDKSNKKINLAKEMNLKSILILLLQNKSLLNCLFRQAIIGLIQADLLVSELKAENRHCFYIRLSF